MNRAGTIKANVQRDKGWDYFDSLPRRYKELIWEAPIMLQLGLGKSGVLSSIEHYTAAIEKVLRDSCRATYGPDHPQSGVIQDITLEDLGL